MVPPVGRVLIGLCLALVACAPSGTESHAPVERRSSVEMPIPPVAPGPDADGCVFPQDASAYQAHWERWLRDAEQADAQSRGWQEISEYRWVTSESALGTRRGDHVVDADRNRWLFVQIRETGCTDARLEPYYFDANGDVFPLDWRVSCRETQRMRVCGTFDGGGCGVAPDGEELGFTQVHRGAMRLDTHKVLYEVDTCYSFHWDDVGEPPP